MDLESMLDKNYNQIVDDRDIGPVISYILRTPSVIDEDLVFVKKLTKVGLNIYKKRQNLTTEILEKLYKFHKEGIEIAENYNKNDLTENNLKKIHSHLMSHCGFITQELFKKTRDPKYLEEAIELQIRSAEIAENLNETEYAAHNYDNAGCVLSSFLDLTDPDKEKEKTLIMLAYDLIKKAGDLDSKLETAKKEILWRYGSASRLLIDLIKNNQEIEFVKQEINEILPKELELTKFITNITEVFTFENVVNLVNLIYEREKTEFWGEKTYNLTAALSRLYKPYDGDLSAKKIGKAGKNAYDLYYKTREIHWLQKARECYGAFLAYYKANPNPTMDRAITSITGIVTDIDLELKNKEDVDYETEDVTNKKPKHFKNGHERRVNEKHYLRDYQKELLDHDDETT